MILNPGFILAIALALIHGFAAKLPIVSFIPRFRWLSFAGGVSLGYVFLEVFPELSKIQEELEHSDITLINYLEHTAVCRFKRDSSNNERTSYANA